MLIGDNIVFLFRLTMEQGLRPDGNQGDVGTLTVDGPFYMYPQGNQRPFTIGMMFDFIGWSLSVRVYQVVHNAKHPNREERLTVRSQNLVYRTRVQPRPPSPLLVLQDYWRSSVAAHMLSWSSWTRGLVRLFAQWQLANCTSVGVQLPAGFIIKDCKRLGPALVLPPSTPVQFFKATSVCASYLPALRLKTDRVAGRGASSLTLRGVHLGVPFIVKFDIHHSNNASEEWDRLAALDVVRAGYGGVLPIPSYYGLFESCMGRFSVLSDNGIDLAHHRSDLAALE